MSLPTISIVIPTLNSSKTLGLCLDSISIQDYPKENIEIVFADGGSIDNTLDIVKGKLKDIKYTIAQNKLKTGEAGKAVGVKESKNEIIALVDSDNLLPDKDWLKNMVEPFMDEEIIASEPLSYTYRKEDGTLTRYCALLGMNDPLCYFLGNYDRYSLLSGKWTGLPCKEEDKGNYLKIEFYSPHQVPTIGANGFLIRRKIFEQYEIGDYLFDIDIICDLVNKGDCKVAKVKVGIIHLFGGTISQFARKQKRLSNESLFPYLLRLFFHC